MNVLSDFTNLYSLSKTLKFELKPYVPENLSGEEKSKYLESLWDSYFETTLYQNDENRNESYPIVKELLDIFHRWFIENVLASFTCSEGRTWDDLYALYIKDKKSKEYVNLQKKIREDIAESFKNHEWWKYINSYKDMIENIIPDLITNSNEFCEVAQNRLGLGKDTLLMHLNRFKSFSVYFKKYKLNRENMYKSEDQATSIANRIVNENFPRFADNIAVYDRLTKNCSVLLSEVEENLMKFLYGCKLNDVFAPNYFNTCLTQRGIVNYNWILGANPNEGVIGINDVGNKYLNQTPQSKLRLKDLRMAMLYKQILSDREQISYIPKQFDHGRDGELQMIEAIKQLYASIKNQELFEKVKRVFKQIASEDVNANNIYVVGNKLTTLSKMLYGSWSVLGEALRKEYVIGSTKKLKKETDLDITEWLSNKCFSLAQIRVVEKRCMGEHSTGIDTFLSTLCLNRWNEELKKWQNISLIDSCIESYSTMFEPITKTSGESIVSNDFCKELIKTHLDKYMDVLHCCEIFRLGKKAEQLDADSIYVEYNSLFETTETDVATLSDIIPLYNKVRNYLTRKISDEGKMLLKFDSPTLADGWDSNNEQSNNAVILLKDDKYYILLLNPTNKPKLNQAITGNVGFKKIVYHQIGNVAADIPNLLVIDGKTVKKTGRVDKATGINMVLEELKDKYLPENINSIRKSQSYLKTSTSFNKEDSLVFTEYYKQRLIEYKGNDIEFKFKDTADYDSYSDFLDDVSRQKFSISFVDYDINVVKTWLESKKAFLFQISNKDFQEGAHGTDNMHTLYWKELFSSRNLSLLNYKLNGEAEFFYRRKLATSTYVHKKSSVLVNKTYADGTPVKSEDYKAFVKYFNREEIDLTDEQTKLLPQVKTNKAKIDIVKDKRYTEHKFLFHIPITINFKSDDFKSDKAYNEYTLIKLREHKKDINIIGIDRGERNLIYVSVINQHGENIIPPRHYNILETPTYDNNVRKYNYLEKLKQVEGKRDEARKNWTKIENIKELKSGYLSQVVHEISKLVVKYNAIIVLEDLNFGFKRGRFNVERQVYQKFETMLIKKLNFLVFKKDSPSTEYGNINNGLQLTSPFNSFKDLGKQCGWLFYVPAEFTSKIDAETGFVNLFNLKKAEENAKAFFSAFDKIEFRNGMFYFSFDYSKDGIHTLKTDFTNKWTLSSHGKRIVMKKNKESQRMEPIDLTNEIKSVFDGKIQLSDLSISKIMSHPEADSICKDLLFKFKWLLQMRNSLPNNDNVDYLLSPVASESPFITGPNNALGINDADANGAYHIALKGLYLLLNDFPQEEKYLKRITTTEWLEFVQKHDYRR